MKQLLLSLLVSSLPHWLPSTVWGGSGEAEADAPNVVVVEAVALTSDDDADDADGGAATTRVWVGCDRGAVALTGDSGENMFVATVAGDGDAARKLKHKTIKMTIRGEHGSDRGWLGISVGRVDDALAAQANVEGRGVLVLNVVEDSPADQAGMQAHDIVLSVDGEAVEGEDADELVARLVKMIGSHKSGETVELVILRSGKETSHTVTLGSRTGKGRLRWVFEREPEELLEETVQTFGKILRRLPDGELVLEELGELGELGDLPADLFKFIPRSGSRSIRITIDGNNKSITCHLNRDDEALTVKREDDGEITVERVDADGKKTTATYADADELRDADKEAYELLSSHSEHSTIHLNLEGSAELDDIDIELDLDNLKEHAFAWKMELQDSLRNANEAYEQAMEQAQEAMEQWKSQGGALRHLLNGGPGSKMFPGLLHLPKPKHTFELREDGKIEIRIRKGDSQLVQLYTNEEDLEERNPKLFAKYKDLMNAGE